MRKRLHRFNTEGIDGLGDRPGAGRKPRITEDERSKIIALVAKDPPGKLLTEPDGVLRAADETKAAYWTLDTLADAAQRMGIAVGRSQVRRILLAEGVRWRNTRPWAESADPEFVPKGPRSSSSTPTRRRAPRWSAWTARTHHSTLFPSGSGMVAGRHRIKAPLEYSRGPDKVWVFGALRVEDGKSLTFTSRSRNAKGYLKLLEKIQRAVPEGPIYLIADNLRTHKSALVRKC